MFHLYTNYGPNTSRIFMMLHETELDHEVHWIDCTRGEHKTPEFLQLSPNAKVPALVDDEPADRSGALALFESAAILTYLADISGRLLPQETRARMEVVKWLFWNQANLSPMFGQCYHFRYYAPPEERNGYAFRRYLLEVRRLLGVLNEQLGGRDFVADRYSIADIACYPWLAIHTKHTDQHFPMAIEEFPQVQDWLNRVAERSAVKSAYDYCNRNYPGHHGSPAEYRKYLYGDHCDPELRPAVISDDGKVTQANE